MKPNRITASKAGSGKAARAAESNRKTKLLAADNEETKTKDKTSVVVPNDKIDDNYCNICAQTVPGPEREEIFAFGRCDHKVCYVCSTRLRVICDQTECPICRDKLDYVIFSHSKDKSFSSIDLKTYILDNSNKIYFENEAIKQSFDKLLQYKCLECSKVGDHSKNSDSARDTTVVSPCERSSKSKNQPVKNYSEIQSDSTRPRVSMDPNDPSHKRGQMDDIIREDSSGLISSSDLPRGALFQDVLSLKNHLNYRHKLRLCDLCLTHNKLFPFEYSYYDFYALKKHMKEGEINTSHRGHPNCQLCHDTFFNLDELLIHMSREHFHCHICARQETNLRYYFNDYPSLREHFRNKHFLCERGNCRTEQFTSAFENKLEYQLHVVNVHGNPSCSKGESRHLRTITLDPTPFRPQTSNQSSRMSNDPNVAIVTTGQMAVANDLRRNQAPENILQQLRQQRLPSRNEFPALGQIQNNAQTTTTSQQVTISSTPIDQSNSGYGPSSSDMRRALCMPKTPSIPITSDHQSFPCMPSGSNTGNLAKVKNSFVRTLGGGIKRPENMDPSEFPPLVENPKPKPNSPKKTKPQSRQRISNNEMTLDELIRNSLVLNSRSATGDQRKGNKNLKHKPIKITL